MGGNYICSACPLGKYKPLAGNDACVDVPPGCWVPAGANSCVTPDAGQDRTCLSGKPCTLSKITGHGLSSKHLVMIMDKCQGTAVYGFPNNGVSKQGGVEYTWDGDIFSGRDVF